MHLDEVKILLKKFSFLSTLVNDINFVTENDDGNTQVDFEDSFA